MMNYLCLVSIFMLLIACSEPLGSTSSESTNKLLKLSVLNKLTAESTPPPPDNNNDDKTFEELKIGDKVSVAKQDNGNGNYTYDFTGLLLNDNHALDSGRDMRLEARYYANFTTQTYSGLLIFPEMPSSENYDWEFRHYELGISYDGIHNTYITSNIFVQSIDYTTVDASAISICVTAMYDGKEDYYYFKGSNVGAGEVELVGKAYYENGSFIKEEGDVYIDTPLSL